MLEDCHAVGEGRKGGGKALKAGNLRKKSFSGACWPGGSKIEAWSLQNRGPEPPKSRPGPSKIEPGGSSRDNFGRHLISASLKEQSLISKFGFSANLAPSWRPKRLQNRGRNPKKSMLKKALFLASILKGFGPRFGEVFERFFGPVETSCACVPQVV